jgi:hypothetical protein
LADKSVKNKEAAMKSMRVCRIALLFLLVPSVPALVFAQSDCSDISQHGLFRSAPTDSLENRTRAFVNWLSENSLDSYAKALNAAREMGVKIDDIPNQIGGHSRDSDWRGYQAALQTVNFADKRNLDKFSRIVNTADQGMKTAWQACLSNSKGQPQAVIELTRDPLQFAVKLEAEETVHIRDFTLTPNTADCTPPVNVGSTIDSSGMILKCTRRVSSDQIQISANTDKGQLSATLPGLTAPSLVATKIIETPLGAPPDGCTVDSKGNHNIDAKSQEGNQPVYVCP